LLGLGLPVKVSNDPFSGSFILDADIKLAMKAGASASTFEIELINLPEDTAKLIKQKHEAAKKPTGALQVEIHLGYFDDPSTTTGSNPVMAGAIMKVHNVVGEDGLLQTRIVGQELGGYLLRKTPFSADQAKRATAGTFLQHIADKAGVRLANGPQLTAALPSYTLQTKTCLEALRILAEKAKVPLVIRDKEILIGPTVGRPEDSAPDFASDENIVKLDDGMTNEESFDPDEQQLQDQLKTVVRTSLKLTLLGLPQLRVGQQVTVKGVENAPTGTLRIQDLLHHFSTKSGYTCEVEVVAAEQGQPAKTSAGVTALVDRMHDVTEGILDQRPAIDMGQVNAYTSGDQEKHLATLDYAQTPPSDAVAPSVTVAITQGTQLHDKPIASPFAWHKCGLVVPVYPGMRAVLAHNRGLLNDAILSGFVWSENPLQERPKNFPGDYWLCLPTQLGPDNQPTGPGVNDLTDKDGLRVIQAKGLHIFVAKDKLPVVGTRPDPPAEKTVVIEHESGTTIMINADGSLRINTKQKELSFTNGSTTIMINADGSLRINTKQKELSFTNGSVTLKLSGSAVEVS
jgi:hypothetical protein